MDGFHRTRACLKYLSERPNDDIRIKAKVYKGRTYRQAFLAAQEMNTNHGVGVTKEEVSQSKFRAAVYSLEFDLSVGDIKKRFNCSQGQGAHIRNALKACHEALQVNGVKSHYDLEDLLEALSDGLSKYDLPASAWDARGFPKIRKLSDAYKGVSFKGDIDESQEWWEAQKENAIHVVTKAIEDFGPDIFREALRQSVRGLELGVSVTRRDKWTKENNYTVEADNYDFNDEAPSLRQESTDF